ncbi:hypothetical protein ACIQYS_14690 [Psychrobacillus sp. NPDC096426]|uniref:hypothetical protein n=1 Tax=Psychrobacillus sp. NPDC096426 TaxID=3364491 RepID=UPI0037FB0D60
MKLKTTFSRFSWQMNSLLDLVVKIGCLVVKNEALVVKIGVLVIKHLCRMKIHFAPSFSKKYEVHSRRLTECKIRNLNYSENNKNFSEENLGSG